MCKCYIDGTCCNGEYNYCVDCVLNPNDNDDNDRMFYDCESDRILTESQLRSEYEEFKHDIELSSGATTFEESLSNALSKDGFLKELFIGG